MAAHGEVDIALDPFPYAGGISTLEALWMGVPVVTLKGAAAGHRASAAILSVLGLNEWIAETPREYLDIVRARAQDIQQLQMLRMGLRQRLACSPVANAEIYVRAVEVAYRDMWRKWCRQ